MIPTESDGRPILERAALKIRYRAALAILETASTPDDRVTLLARVIDPSPEFLEASRAAARDGRRVARTAS